MSKNEQYPLIESLKYSMINLIQRALDSTAQFGRPENT